MTQHFLAGNPTIPVILRRSSRARRISLRVSRLDGRVSLTLPAGVPEREGLDFVRQKETWIRDQMAQRPALVMVEEGADVLVEGRLLRVCMGPGRSVNVNDGDLYVPGATDRVAARVQGE